MIKMYLWYIYFIYNISYFIRRMLSEHFGCKHVYDWSTIKDNSTTVVYMYMLYYIHRYLSALHFVRLFVPQVGTLILIVCQIHKHNMYHVVLKPTQTNEKQHYPIFNC